MSNMRVFTTSCIEDKYRYEMVAMYCTEDEAKAFLMERFAGTDWEIYEEEHLTNGLVVWHTGLWRDKFAEYRSKRKYFYDEERQYLMAE